MEKGGSSMTKMKVQMPSDAAFILNKLNEGGHEAYIVGGCVRDSILGRIPQDWDITTSALPEETKTFFDHTFDTGIQHGTITVVLHKENYEVTTYRIDGIYEDGRHPRDVTFTRSLEEDLKLGMERCDAIVVTGAGTGINTDLEKIKTFRSILGDFPLIVGAGMTADTAQEQLAYSDGAIVGSYFKEFGEAEYPVDEERVKEFICKARASNGV